MATFAVTYRYGSDTAPARDQHRPRHVDFLQRHFDDKRLLLSGPFGADEQPGAELIWTAATKAELESLLDQDPFSVNGLIAAREIRQWNIFFGAAMVGA
ncbi:hypothetical protein E3T55_03290 [Cryobacterium frigoriphilum]|uniref:YCII-related domain-containing protein n=1 Tax=Cryobacterium frigoriphilum TaxID=1259150 RepID=A0A4R9A913_9MICO|nr:YciI family protein [Cryobacterium frigoriphilum]TFD54470.1 hypothetical protein E3T55_03290 [Cryobacterium frigoriphilum]